MMHLTVYIIMQWPTIIVPLFIKTLCIKMLPVKRGLEWCIHLHDIIFLRSSMELWKYSIFLFKHNWVYFEIRNMYYICLIICHHSSIKLRRIFRLGSVSYLGRKNAVLPMGCFNLIFWKVHPPIELTLKWLRVNFTKDKTFLMQNWYHQIAKDKK